jgi:FixJ family two-component response regulator
MSKPEQNIVVVDDDASMRHAIERLLKAAGFHATTFSSAEALLQTDAALSAGCLVLDIHLPGLSGFELRQRLAESGHASPVIFITAHDRPTGREQAMQAGGVAYFTKPFSGRALLAAVTKAIDRN